MTRMPGSGKSEFEPGLPNSAAQRGAGSRVEGLDKPLWGRVSGGLGPIGFT